MTTVPVIRIARPTDRLDVVVSFYEEAVGLVRLGAFQNHDGFDGVMLGVPGAPYHLEFTHNPAHRVGRAPSREHLLVVYLPDRSEWQQAVDRMAAAGHAPVASFNPYWDRAGRTFEDPDGYRVVLHHGAWSAHDGERLERIASGPARDDLLPLFLLADDSATQVASYYQQGELFVLRGLDGAACGIVLVTRPTDTVAELKAVAVVRERQGQGVGRRMIALVLEEVRRAGVRRVTVGTASSGIGQLAFYQKAGFRVSTIERDFFTPERGYPDGIEEHGIPLRDMVWMDLTLPAV